jgi:hypothetical protein
LWITVLHWSTHLQWSSHLGWSRCWLWSWLSWLWSRLSWLTTPSCELLYVRLSHLPARCDLRLILLGRLHAFISILHPLRCLLIVESSLGSQILTDLSFLPKDCLSHSSLLALRIVRLEGTECSIALLSKSIQILTIAHHFLHVWHLLHHLLGTLGH